MNYDTCNYCGERKPISEFTKNVRSPKGYVRRCKPCNSAKVAESKALNARNQALIESRRMANQ